MKKTYKFVSTYVFQLKIKCMKKQTILLGLLALCSCSESIDDYETTNLNNEMECEVNHFVTLNDVNALCAAQRGLTRSSLTGDFNIKCFTDAEHDTLLYMCNNKGGGWTIYSSDMRVPAIVAQSSSGTIEEALINVNLRAWLGTMAEDMKVIKHLKDSELKFSSEEIKSNKSFWSSVSRPDEFAKNELTSSQTLVRKPIVVTDPTPYGHYELVNSESYTEIYDSIPRLTETNWRQEYPFNIYCPKRTDDSIRRAPAGCVAIAAAQMLYFLHEKINVPELAPSEAECTGNVEHYQMNQSNYTSEYWCKMNETYKWYYAAPLVANVGCLLGNRYGNEVTYAHVEDLKDKVFKVYGIDCSFGRYDASVLCNNLKEGMPVVVSAATKQDGSSKGRHVFIADKYKRVRMVTKNSYEWVYDESPQNPDGSLIPLPYVENKIEYTYHSPYISMIGFNWGWGRSEYDKSQWFALTDEWIYDDDEPCQIFKNNMKMITDFKVLK
jgi:hypothetical protein